MSTQLNKKPDRYQEPNRALEDLIRRAVGADNKHLKMHLDRWLKKGADPNSPPLLGKKSSMMMTLDPGFLLNLADRINIGTALIDAGGNPFLHTDLFRKLISNKQITFLEPLIRQEQSGIRMRAPDGNNILHEIMSGPRAMYEFEIDTRNGFDGALTLISETNHQGQTPCHVLWNDLNSTFIDAAWRLTYRFEQHGAHIHQQDNNGVSIQQAMVNRLSTVDFELLKIDYPETASDIESWMLRVATPLNAPHMGRARRL